jgi:hypothetical protein
MWWSLGPEEKRFISLHDGKFKVSNVEQMIGDDWPIVIKRIRFAKGVPSSATTSEEDRFYNSGNGFDLERFVARLMDLSLTSRIMFVHRGFLYVSETEDNTTNITADIIDAFIKTWTRRIEQEGRRI